MNYDKFLNREVKENFDVIEFLNRLKPEVNQKGNTYYTIGRVESFVLLKCLSFDLDDFTKARVSEICSNIKRGGGVLSQPPASPVVIDVKSKSIKKNVEWLLVNQYQRTYRKIWIELEI